MVSYCACALPWPLPEVSIRGAGQKDRSSGDENEFYAETFTMLRAIALPRLQMKVFDWFLTIFDSSLQLFSGFRFH